MRDIIWNPWHGCKKYSEGCLNCYVYRRDESIGKDASIVEKTKSFDDPIKKNRSGDYKIPDDSRVFACMTSDFFLDEADQWRDTAWSYIRERSNINFSIITKRIARFTSCLPDDWGEGYPNVAIGCTIENQRQCDKRLEHFRLIPAKSKFITCEPLLSAIDMGDILGDWVTKVVAGGESGPCARECRYEWILNIREQCISKNVGFWFKQTGANFIKDGKRFSIPREKQMPQARKAAIDYYQTRR